MDFRTADGRTYQRRMVARSKRGRAMSARLAVVARAVVWLVYSVILARMILWAVEAMR